MRSTTHPTLEGRCVRCFLPEASCLCALVPRVATETRFLIVRHCKETLKTSNSARIAALALPSCRVIEHGTFESPPIVALGSPGSWLLFPGASQPTLGARPAELIVIDGSWRQARRIFRHVPGLRELPRLSLPPPAARDRLRRPPTEEGMSTLEAIAGAVAVLEGPERAAPLYELFDVFVERAAAVRGRRRGD